MVNLGLFQHFPNRFTPNYFRSKNRKSWTVPACLSTQTKTMFVSFRAWGHIGRIVSDDLKNKVNIERLGLHISVRLEDQSQHWKVNGFMLVPFSDNLKNKVDIERLGLDISVRLEDQSQHWTVRLNASTV
jgi:hypothetical protein